MLSLTDAARRNATVVPERKRYSRIPEVLPIPDLIELQRDSFRWFIDHGLRELFDEISPIQDFTGKVMELHFKAYEFGEPKYSELECRTRDLTYSKPLYVNVELRIKETGEIQEQRVYMGDFQTMTDQGTFIINGAERVVVSQLVRSPGVYYTATEDPATGRPLYSAKVIPNRGAWLEFETAARHLLYVKVDRKRKLEATKLLRAVGYESNEEMVSLFSRVDTGDQPYIASTLEKDSTNTRQEALIDVYKKLRPGDPPTGDNAEKLVESLFFNFRRYDLGRVGRYKFNKKLDGVAERMGIELSARPADHQPRGHRGHRGPAHRAQQRSWPGGRHRPPGQSAHPGQRRADPERVPGRPAAHGARGQGAHDHPGGGQGHPQCAHQHPAGGGGHEGVLRRQPAVAVHGPDQSTRRADQQATPVGAGPRRPVARARRHGRARRASQPLRPHLPHRDPGRPQHRAHRLAGHVRPDQRVRLHRDALPQGQAQRRLERPRHHRRDRGRRRRDQGRRGGAQEGQALHGGCRRRAQEAEGQRVPHPTPRDRRDRLSRGLRRGGALRRPGQRGPGRRGPLHRRARAGTPPGPVPGGTPAADRVHGREPQAGRLGGHGAHPVPGA